MADVEKVIKGLHQHCECSLFYRCGECPYYAVSDGQFSCKDRLLDDALAMLKELEAMIEQLNRFANGFSRDAVPVVRCKDCVESYFASNRIQSEQTLACGKYGIDVTPEYFCADGERKG